MAPTPIRTIKIKSCGCINSAEVELASLHALIGPNDSGKSTILRALRTATQFAAGEFTRSGQGEILPFTPLLSEASAGASISLTLATSFRYQIYSSGGSLFEFADHGARPLLSDRQARSLLGPSQLWASSLAHRDPLERLAEARAQLAPATLVRFDPDALRAASPLLLDTEGIRFADERGTGLAAVLDAIQNRDREAIAAIEQRVRELFPTVKTIGLSVPAPERKAVKATLKDGKDVSASEMSEGLLYFLGFAALQYCGASLLLVEEPENGLHPSRIRDVVAILRKVSEGAQVVIATHSPLVINELRPDEVTVVTRDETTGTKCTPIRETQGFDDRAKVYELGELWLSYANGKDEAPLLGGGARE